jgi:Zn-finger nucleic acid-binding protein
MNCPACKEAMIVVEHNGIELDCCPACRGLWLDASELGLLLGDAVRARALLEAGNPAHAPGEKPRRCPICRRRMRKCVAADGGTAVTDACRLGHGLWFDEGELFTVLRQKGAAADDPVFGWLRDLFGAAEEGEKP